MGRSPCCDKANVKKGPWSLEENFKLKEYIDKYGTGGNWLALPQKVGLKRCGKSCRLRWLNYLRPNLKHGGFSEEEENIICSLYISIGSRWSIIAAQLPGRTDNDIKNYWNTKLKKKLFGKRKDHQIRRLAEAKQERKDMQSYETAEANPSPNIYWPRQHTGGVDQRTNIGINGPYPNFGPGIASHLFEQNCGQRITESSSSSEPATFLVDPQQVQLDQEFSDYNNSCLRTLLQMLEGGLVDQHSNNMMAMISHPSPVEASKCTNASEILCSTYNQYNWSQISYETSASPVPMHAGYHITLENPSASSSAKGGSYESTRMNNFDSESNNVDGESLGFSRELNDLYSLGGHGSD